MGAIGLASGIANVTYPEHTYADLLFPMLDLRGEALEDVGFIDLDMPAVRVNLTCTKLRNGTADLLICLRTVGEYEPNSRYVSINQTFFVPIKI